MRWNRLKTIATPAQRGRLLGRRGVELAPEHLGLPKMDACSGVNFGDGSSKAGKRNRSFSRAGTLFQDGVLIFKASPSLYCRERALPREGGAI
jgi:hypothetical protein